MKKLSYIKLAQGGIKHGILEKKMHYENVLSYFFTPSNYSNLI